MQMQKMTSRTKKKEVRTSEAKEGYITNEFSIEDTRYNITHKKSKTPNKFILYNGHQNRVSRIFKLQSVVFIHI